MDIEMGIKGQDFKRLPNPERMTDDALIKDFDHLIGQAESAADAERILLDSFSPRPVVTVEEAPDGRSFVVNIRTKITEYPRTYIIDKIAKAA